MTRRGLATLGVAVCCVLAIGASATAMESAVETTPDDAIDVGYDAIPLDGDTVDRLKRQMQPDGPAADGRGPPADEASESTRPPPDADAEDTAGSGAVPPESGPERSGARPSDGPLATGTGSTDGDPDLLARLLDVLRLVLLLLVPLAIVGLAARFRDRLAELLRSVVAALMPTRPGRGGSTAAAAGTPPPAPENDVAAAWCAMVSRFGLAGRVELTPGECLAVATAAGVDPEPAERLTGLFERVQYGGEAVTDRKRERSRRALQRVLEQSPEGPG